MAPNSPIPEIAIFGYPGAQIAATHGLADLFLVADELMRARLGRAEPLIRVSRLEFDPVAGTVSRAWDSGAGASGAPDFVILPPSLGDATRGAKDARLVAYLQARHAAGAVLASVCAGAYLLAATGLLDGRTVTTHWACVQDLAERFPGVRVDGDRLLIDEGDIVTAGGLMAWIDLGLLLVERILGQPAMLETARYLLVDPPGREQRNYSVFSPRLNHGDAAILKVQHWLQTSAARDATAAAMAGHAGLEARTFLRRFRKATGLAPKEYCQQLRIARARELLAATGQGADRIAWTVGYTDPAAFRKVFARVTGLSPGEYRRRFGRPRSQPHREAPRASAAE